MGGKQEHWTKNNLILILTLPPTQWTNHLIFLDLSFLICEIVDNGWHNNLNF